MLLASLSIFLHSVADARMQVAPISASENFGPEFGAAPEVERPGSAGADVDFARCDCCLPFGAPLPTASPEIVASVSVRLQYLIPSSQVMRDRIGEGLIRPPKSPLDV